MGVFVRDKGCARGQASQGLCVCVCVFVRDNWVCGGGGGVFMRDKWWVCVFKRDKGCGCG